MAILLLLGGLFFKDNIIMWMAATSELYSVIRGGLIAVLLSLLLTTPPRSLSFRIFFGILAITTAALTLSLTYTNNMNFLDSLLFMSASILFSLAALEPYSKKTTRQIKVVEEEGEKRTYRIPVSTH